MGSHDAGHAGDDLSQDAGGADAEAFGEDVVRRDATLAHEVGGGKGQTIDDIDEEVADLLAEVLALVGIAEADFLARGIDDGCQPDFHYLADGVEGLTHQQGGVVEDALHIDLDGAGAFCLQELFQLKGGLFDMGTHDEAAGIERADG